MDFDQQAHTHKHVEYSLKWANKFELHGNAIKKIPGNWFSRFNYSNFVRSLISPAIKNWKFHKIPNKMNEKEITWKK